MNVTLPATMGELWSILEDQPDAVLCAGGTDVLVKVRAGAIRPQPLVCLEKLGDLRGIRDDGESIFIGSCTTHTELLASATVRASIPLLAEAVHVLGSPPVRNMATLGGNLCTASPAGDTLPPLYVLDAVVVLRSGEGRRCISVDRFILGPGRTALQKGEIVEGVVVTKPKTAINHFEKVGQRKAMSISIASLAGLVETGSGDTVRRICLAWGSVGPTVIRSKAIEESLTGERLTIENLRKIFPMVRQVISPISDVRAGAEYRKSVSCNLLLRLSQYVRKAS
jgi:CO/xanthine dehydrogenase FAD-binding subunit